MTEEETGLEGAVADDADAEYVRNVCERDIVHGGAALARYLPLLRWLLANPARATHKLQAAAALTFTRLLPLIFIYVYDPAKTTLQSPRMVTKIYVHQQPRGAAACPAYTRNNPYIIC